MKHWSNFSFLNKNKFANKNRKNSQNPVRWSDREMKSRVLLLTNGPVFEVEMMVMEPWRWQAAPSRELCKITD